MLNKMKAFGAALLLATSLISWANEGNVTFAQAKIAFGPLALDVEFADSAEARAQGLMFRKELCDLCGMLFRFDFPKQASMWMKNTYIPLDVAFIDDKGVIVDILPLYPLDLTSVSASSKVRYALEMNQGWFASHGIKVGDNVVLTLPTH